MNTPFFCVEGVIGVGKTTLSKALAAHYQIKCLHEIVEENPFLEKFYDDMDAWSFQTEMFFLCNRVKQLEDIKPMLRDQQPIIADYHISKNRLFARRTLDAKKWDQYERIFEILNESLPKPAAIIYLKASHEIVMERIKKRGRSFEKDMDPAYIKQLASDYDQAMIKLAKETPVVTIHTDNLDFVSSQSDLAYILTKIDSHLSSV